MSFFVLWTHVSSLLAHREFWYMLSTPRGSEGPSFPRDRPFFRDCVTFVIFCTLYWSQDFVLFRGLHEDFGGSSSWSTNNLLSRIFNVATEFLSLCFADFSLFASAWLFISLMVHPSTLFAEFTRRWSCAITIQVSTAVEIVLKWTASSVLPLEPFLQSFSFQRFAEPQTSWLFNSSNARVLEER